MCVLHSRYDAYRLAISRKADECAAQWRAARMNNERQDAFDELTEMIGPCVPCDYYKRGTEILRTSKSCGA